LYKEFIRAIKVLKPRCIVLENVSGMMSTGNFRAQIEKDLRKASGMIVTSKLLNAADYGVPQRRQRLVFVGIEGDEPFDFDEIKPTHGPGRAKPYITIKDAIGDLPNLRSGEEASIYLKEPFSDYQRLMRKGLAKNTLTNHRSPKHPADTLERIRSTKPGEPMYPAFKQRIRLAWHIQSPTQVAGGIRPQFQFGHPRDVRGLTIRERCRIQSFPDNFFVVGGIVQGRVQTGNAVPPLLAKALAEVIKKKI
jgi:DNA (cytosine-5)-methyltransferase 1